jgi:hypothetical protein
VPPHSILVYVTIEDRLPGDQVCLNFTAELEVLDRFLSSLEKDGLKFTRNEFIPGLLILCRADKDRGGLMLCRRTLEGSRPLGPVCQPLQSLLHGGRNRGKVYQITLH